MQCHRVWPHTDRPHWLSHLRNYTWFGTTLDSKLHLTGMHCAFSQPKTIWKFGSFHEKEVRRDKWSLKTHLYLQTYYRHKGFRNMLFDLTCTLLTFSSILTANIRYQETHAHPFFVPLRKRRKGWQEAEFIRLNVQLQFNSELPWKMESTAIGSQNHCWDQESLHPLNQEKRERMETYGDEGTEREKGSSGKLILRSFPPSNLRINIHRCLSA